MERKYRSGVFVIQRNGPDDAWSGVGHQRRSLQCEFPSSGGEPYGYGFGGDFAQSNGLGEALSVSQTRFRMDL